MNQQMGAETVRADDPPPGLYRHYKGGVYLLLFLAEDHETRQALVIYRSISRGVNIARPLADWMAPLPDGGPRYVREDGLITRAEAAKILGVTERTVAKWADVGELEAHGAAADWVSRKSISDLLRSVRGDDLPQQADGDRSRRQEHYADPRDGGAAS
jgi:hypothetical protein